MKHRTVYSYQQGSYDQPKYSDLVRLILFLLWAYARGSGV